MLPPTRHKPCRWKCEVRAPSPTVTPSVSESVTITFTWKAKLIELILLARLQLLWSRLFAVVTRTHDRNKETNSLFKNKVKLKVFFSGVLQPIHVTFIYRKMSPCFSSFRAEHLEKRRQVTTKVTAGWHRGGGGWGLNIPNFLPGQSKQNMTWQEAISPWGEYPAVSVQSRSANFCCCRRGRSEPRLHFLVSRHFARSGSLSPSWAAAVWLTPSISFSSSGSSPTGSLQRLQSAMGCDISYYFLFFISKILMLVEKRPKQQLKCLSCDFRSDGVFLSGLDAG